MRRTAVPTALAAVVLALAGCGGSPATHAPPARGSGTPPVTAGSDYLALGDSVSFGYREPTTSPRPDYPDAASFVGFPELVGTALGLHVANASCPGETTVSLTTAGGASNGCENSPTGGPAYRKLFPLHVSYAGTQLQYAVAYLEAHPDTRLVTLMIGANDGFLCAETTKDGCASEGAALLAKVGAGVRTILDAVRLKAGYLGQVVVVNYYTGDYSSPLAAASRALNQAMDDAAKPFVVSVADGYAAFQQAAAASGGDACKAGLLTRLSTGACGVHPSAAGQQLLAHAVEGAVRRSSKRLAGAH